MKKRMQEILVEILKDSRKSDRDIAKKLGISQPTVTRIRKKLERSVIKVYTAIPIFPEIGVEMLSFNFGKCSNPKKDTEFCLKQMTKTNPKILFISSGEGMGKNCLIVAIHKDYRDYVEFINNIRLQCKGIRDAFESFLAPTTREHVLDFANPVTNLIKEKKLKI
jgi:DNA-binding Lrp family transcriptional regulator